MICTNVHRHKDPSHRADGHSGLEGPTESGRDSECDRRGRYRIVATGGRRYAASGAFPLSDPNPGGIITREQMTAEFDFEGERVPLSLRTLFPRDGLLALDCVLPASCRQGGPPTDNPHASRASRGCLRPNHDLHVLIESIQEADQAIGRESGHAPRPGAQSPDRRRRCPCWTHRVGTLSDAYVTV